VASRRKPLVVLSHGLSRVGSRMDCKAPSETLNHGLGVYGNPTFNFVAPHHSCFPCFSL